MNLEDVLITHGRFQAMLRADRGDSLRVSYQFMAPLDCIQDVIAAREAIGFGKIYEGRTISSFSVFRADDLFSLAERLVAPAHPRHDLVTAWQECVETLPIHFGRRPTSKERREVVRVFDREMQTQPYIYHPGVPLLR